MRDLTGRGFAGVDDVPIDGLFQTGIVAASFASDATEAATLARSVIASHGLANSGLVVAWEPRGGSPAPWSSKGLGKLDGSFPDDFRSIHSIVIASGAKQSRTAPPHWIASSLRSSQ